MASPDVLKPGLIAHVVNDKGECTAAVITFAPDPTHANLRDLDTDRRYRNLQHNASGTEPYTWHTVDGCRAVWPVLPDGQYAQRVR